MQVERDFSVAIQGKSSGARVRNTWVICQEVGDNSLKGELIPNVIRVASIRNQSRGNLTLHDEPAAYQLVGEVTAHQG